MNYEIKDGKERIPDEEDIYGVNDTEENEYDYEVWMPHEARLRARRDRLRTLALGAIIVFVVGFACFEFIRLVLNR